MQLVEDRERRTSQTREGKVMQSPPRMAHASDHRPALFMETAVLTETARSFVRRLSHLSHSTSGSAVSAIGHIERMRFVRKSEDEMGLPFAVWPSCRLESSVIETGDQVASGRSSRSRNSTAHRRKLQSDLAPSRARVRSFRGSYVKCTSSPC